MLKFGSNSFHIYGLLIGLAVVSALEVSTRFAKKKKIAQTTVEHAFIWIILFGLLGARIYHVLDFWGRFYGTHLNEVFAVWNGGLGIWGGILGGCIGFFCFYFFQEKSSRKFWMFSDIGFLGVPLAQAIGRWGNYFNNELGGLPTSLPWGIVNNDGVRVHPLFLYESVLNLILFAILLKITKKNTKSGLITSTYLIGYGLIRLMLETLRPTDIVWRIWGVPTAQIASIVAITVGIFILIKTQKRDQL